MKIEFPASVEDAIGSEGVYRAGGVDLQELLRIHPQPEMITDISRTPDLRGCHRTSDDGTRVGATTTLSEAASSLADAYPALALTINASATPQIRNTATVAGNLAQATRCWYFRNPLSTCFKSGGNSCPADSGDNLYGVIFNQGPCLYPHPSSLGMALLTYDARFEIDNCKSEPIAALWGDGQNPHSDNILRRGELITAITLPQPWQLERAGYVRSISRFAAEWPLVECCCRVIVEGGIISRASIAVGGVANTPLRLSNVESFLVGQTVDAEILEQAGLLGTAGATPSAQTRYKVMILRTAIADALSMALGLETTT